MTTRIKLDGRESLAMKVTRDDTETGEVTLTITAGDGEVRISAGRTEDDANSLLDELCKAAVQATAIRDGDWTYPPSEHDAWITLDRGNYYVNMGSSQPGNHPDHGYPDVRVAVYELAELMAEHGEFPPAWASGEHGPSVREINGEVRAFHDQGGDKMLPLEGVVYAEGDEVGHDGDAWVVRRDYGTGIGVVLCNSGARDILVTHSQLTPVPADNDDLAVNYQDGPCGDR